MAITPNPVQVIQSGLKIASRFVEQATLFFRTLTTPGENPSATQTASNFAALFTQSRQELRRLLLDWRRVCGANGNIVELHPLDEGLASVLEAFDALGAATTAPALQPAKIASGIDVFTKAASDCDRLIANLQDDWAQVAAKYRACASCGCSLSASDTETHCAHCRVQPNTVGELMRKTADELRSLPADGDWAKLQHGAIEFFGQQRFTATTRDRLRLWLGSMRLEAGQQVDDLPLSVVAQLLSEELNRKASAGDKVATTAASAAPLSERQYLLLQALAELGGISPDRRIRTADLVARAEGSEANPETFKKPIANLVEQGLMDSQSGRNGGVWLTPKGIELARQIE